VKWDKVSTVLAYPWDGRTQGLDWAGAFLCHQKPFLTCGNQVRNCFFLIVIDAVEPVDWAPVGLPMVRHETDVLFDPDDEHGRIVPLGTAGDTSDQSHACRSPIDESSNMPSDSSAHRTPCYGRLAPDDPRPIAARAGGRRRMVRDGAYSITHVAGEAPADGARVVVAVGEAW